MLVPLFYMVPDWSGWFVSALRSAFKQTQGACTLDVSLRLVCSGLQLVRGSFKSTSSCCELRCPGCFLGSLITQSGLGGVVVCVETDSGACPREVKLL